MKLFTHAICIVVCLILVMVLPLQATQTNFKVTL